MDGETEMKGEREREGDEERKGIRGGGVAIATPNSEKRTGVKK